MSIILHEGRHAGAYIVSEDAHLSREEVIIAAGCVIPAGTVLGQRFEDKKCVPYQKSQTDGTSDFVGICFDNVDASQGDQRAVMTSRLAAVKKSELIWPDDMTESDIANLAQDFSNKNIVLR